MITPLLKIDVVYGDTVEVTFVEYGNSATCLLGDLQPKEALISEDELGRGHRSQPDRKGSR